MRHLSFEHDKCKDVTLPLRERGILPSYVISFFIEEFVKEYTNEIESKFRIHGVYDQQYWMRFSLEWKVPDLFKEEAKDLTMAEVEQRLINAVEDIFNPIFIIDGKPVMCVRVFPFIDLKYERSFWNEDLSHGVKE